MTTTWTKEAARIEYKRIRSACKIDSARFDYLATGLAHEHADGEEVEPLHWVMAAREVAHEAA